MGKPLMKALCHQLRGTSHVTPEPAEVMVGVFTFNSTVEPLMVYLSSLETQRNI